MKTIIFTILLCLSIALFGQSYPYRQFSSKDGLISNIVYDAIQDNRGFMWFATNVGVSRFDGNKWINYTTQEGLNDNEILKIKKDNKGRLWLMAFNGAVNIIENDTILNDKNCPVLAQMEKGFYYRHFYSDTSNLIWLSNTRTSSYVLKDIKIVESYGKLDYSVIFKNDLGIVKLDEINRLTKDCLKPTSLILNERLKSWQKGDESHLLGLSRNFVYRLDQNGDIKKYSISLPIGFNFVDFYFINENELWIVADKNGVLRYKFDKDQYVLKERLFKDNYITSTYIDVEGNYWFTSYGSGIFMLPSNFKQIQTYNKTNGLQGNDVFSVFVDKNENIWAGHKYEGVDVITKNKIYNSQLTNSNVTVGRVRDIQLYKNGEILIAYDEGLIASNTNLKNGSKYKRISLELSNGRITLEQPIKDIAFDSKENIYIASQENLHILSSKSLRFKNPIARSIKLKSQRFYTLAVDKNDILWYFGANGLAKLNNGKLQNLEHISKKIKGRAEDMIWVDDLLFISTVGYGIFVIKDEKILENITSADGLMSNNCSKMFAFDKDIYVCSNKGLNRISINNKTDLNISSISANIHPDQINDVFINQNNIYLASLEGITILPNTIWSNKNLIKPKIYIEKVIYKGKTISNHEKVNINFSDRHITFHFTSPVFNNNKGIEYYYKLGQNQWIKLASPVLELNELRPGFYNLYVKVRHSNTIWSNELVYPFQVERPFYLAWWFYITLGVILLAWIMYIWRSKIQRLEMEQKLKLNYEQEINKLQLKSLQAMMNPHFVFNSLSAIQQQINAGENSKASTYLTRFSKLLRKNLESINESYITIEEEIARLVLYLESEKMRLDNLLEYNIICNKDIDKKTFLIPTMLLQPLVENAIWHGIIPSERKGQVVIYFNRVENRLNITIEDNGIGIESSESTDRKNKLKGQAIGMKITSDRLKYLEQKMGSPIKLIITDLTKMGLQGTRILIEMDLIDDV